MRQALLTEIKERMSLEILVGAWGWKYQSWGQDQYYPDDLPADWRLSYYSNEFDMAVIPASYWASADLVEEDWLDDVDDDFEFCLHWPVKESDQALLGKITAFIGAAGDQVSALLVDHQQWLGATPQQRQVLEELSARYAVRYFNNADAESCFVYEDEQMLSSSDILLLRSDEKELLRDLTRRLQQTIKAQKLERIILMPANDTNEVSIARLKELATLVNLLAI